MRYIKRIKMAMMTLTGQLLLVSDVYCAAVNRSRSRISTIVFGGGDRIDGIARGKDLNTRSFEKAMFWFASNWPEGLAWPEGIERPSPEPLEVEHSTSLDQSGAAA